MYTRREYHTDYSYPFILAAQSAYKHVNCNWKPPNKSGDEQANNTQYTQLLLKAITHTEHSRLTASDRVVGWCRDETNTDLTNTWRLRIRDGSNVLCEGWHFEVSSSYNMQGSMVCTAHDRVHIKLSMRDVAPNLSQFFSIFCVDKTVISILEYIHLFEHNKSHNKRYNKR